MKSFTVGPVEMYPSTKSILEKGIVYFRTEEYGNIVNNCLSRLQLLLGTKTEKGLLYFACSGTGAMEATVDNCLSKDDKVLIINGGSFGHRFCELCQWHELNYTSVDLKWNETLEYKHLEQYENKGFTTLLVNLHETSTGQLYDIKLLSEFCKRNNMMLMVDAISTFLADDYEMDKNGIDVTIFSSQKGLCLSPGMSFIAFSQRMKEKILNSTKITSSYYFNFKSYFNNIERWQTPFTPPVCIMYELKDMLDLIDKFGGKEKWLNYIEQKGKYFREKVKDLNLIIPSYPKSNMLTPVYFENNKAHNVFEYLKNNFQIYINPCGGELSTKLFRVSHIGNTNFNDIDDLLEKIKIAINNVQI